MRQTATYSTKLTLANQLTALGARAVTTSAITGVRPSDARQLFTDTFERPSHSGRTPTEPQWFLATQQRRKHAALLVLMYAKYRESFSNNPEGHALATVLAYQHYKEMTGAAGETAPLVSIERFQLLAGVGFRRNWREVRRGGVSAFHENNVKLMPCKLCRVIHLAEAHYVSYICPSHEQGV